MRTLTFTGRFRLSPRRVAAVGIVVVAAAIVSFEGAVGAAPSEVRIAVARLDQFQERASVGSGMAPAARASAALALRNQLTRRFDWALCAVAIAVPTIAGFLVAAAVRLIADDPAIGNAVGAGVILAVSLLLFAQAFIDLSRMHQACAAAGVYCPVFPGDLNRYSVVGICAFLDVAVLYLANLRLEEWRRGRAAARA